MAYQRTRNLSTSSSETLVPTIDPENPLYCPSVSAASYLNSIRHQLGVPNLDMENSPDAKVYSISGLASNTPNHIIRQSLKKIVADSGVRKRRSNAHIPAPLAKENKLKLKRAMKKAQAQGKELSSFARSLGQVLLQAEKEREKQKLSMIAVQKKQEMDVVEKGKEAQQQEHPPAQVQAQDNKKKTQTKKKQKTTKPSHFEVDTGDCVDFGTPQVLWGPSTAKNSKNHSPRATTKVRSRPIRKTRKDKAATAASIASTGTGVPAQSAIFHPPHPDINFDFTFLMADTSPIRLPPLPPIPTSSAASRKFFGISMPSPEIAVSPILPIPGTWTDMPVVEEEVAPVPLFLPSSIAFRARAGRELRFSSRFSISSVLEVGDDEDIISPIARVQAQAKGKAKKGVDGGLIESMDKKKKQKSKTGAGTGDEGDRKRRLEEAFPQLLRGRGAFRRSFLGVEDGKERKKRKSGDVDVAMADADADGSGYADADRATAMLMGVVPGDPGKEGEVEEDDTLISELVELRQENETGPLGVVENWREVEAKRKKKTGFPPRSFPAFAGYVYSPLSRGTASQGVAMVARGDDGDEDSSENRIRELEDTLYGSPIGTETPRGFGTLAKRLDEMIPGIKLGERLTGLATPSESSYRHMQHFLAGVSMPKHGGTSRAERTHQGVVDFLGGEGLLNERILEVFRSSEVRKVVLGSSVADEGGLNMGGRGVFDVLNKPNSFLFLTEIDFGGTKIEDVDLVKVGRLPRLAIVGLDNTGIGNEGHSDVEIDIHSVFHLVPLKQTLLQLSVAMNPNVDDEGVPALIMLYKLRKLCIVDTGIGMDGLRKMARVINEEMRAMDVEIPIKCEEYIESIPRQYLLQPQPPLIAIPTLCSRLSAGALKRNLEAHREVNRDILAGGTKEEMKDRLERILKRREVDIVVWGMIFGHGDTGHGRSMQ
ncbi:hypothetical protein D9758_014089 [Tetrapyrgos nigripes]|uniref:Uncharacterized protein n=1 Tax=Tetrapyrgos nigripes TaxID=182062 RepID=A0A8H5CH18_9AGAR|nr:hypothetical protein D9758_014089 [Tetrapyrgos nigripes]